QEAFSSLDFNQLYPYLRSINRISDDGRLHCHTIHDDTCPIYVSCPTIRSPIKIHRPAEKMSAYPKTISSLKRTRYNHMLNIQTGPVAIKGQSFLRFCSIFQIMLFQCIVCSKQEMFFHIW